MPQNMDQAMQMAQIMSSAKMVPKHLQGDVGTCFMVVEQSMRWNMSPFAVAQCTSNIGGKLMYEGKLVAGVASATHSIVGEFDYVYTGDPLKPEGLSVTASAVRASDGQRKEINLKWSDAKTTNEFWKKQPEQQLSYAAARVWCRRWSPGPMLGVYAPEEFNEPPPPPFKGQTLDHRPEPAAPLNDAIPERVMAAPAPAQSVRDMVRERLAECESAADVIAVGELPQVKRAEAKAPPKVWEEIKDMMADRYAVFVNTPHDPDTGEVTEADFPGDR